MRNVGKILRALTRRLLASKPANFQKRPYCASDVNAGWCAEWAEEAQALVGGKAIWLDGFWSDHMVLLLDGRYYDAENPDGVDRVTDLRHVRGHAKYLKREFMGSRRNPGSRTDLLNLLEPVREAISIASEFGEFTGSLESQCDLIEREVSKSEKSPRLKKMLLELDESARDYASSFEKMLPAVAERLRKFSKSVNAMRRNPNDEERLAEIKFAAKLFRESRGGKACDVTAKLGGKVIGRAVFHGYSSGGEAFISEANAIWVHPKHRRLGVASRMVTLAEETMGAKWRAGKAITEGGAGFIAGRRRNPPKDIDADAVLGGECAVWAMAAALGMKIPDVRRAFLAAGVDIWTHNGLAKGTPMEHTRAVLKHLDVDKRIVEIGSFVGMGPKDAVRERMASMYKQRFGEGFGAQYTVADRTGTTVGNIVAEAKRRGLAAMVVTGVFPKVYYRDGQLLQPRGAPRAKTHLLGYSPSLGVYDTMVSRPYLEVFKIAVERTGDMAATNWREVIKPMDWHHHRGTVPEPRRNAIFWILFRGE